MNKHKLYIVYINTTVYTLAIASYYEVITLNEK